MAVAVSVFTSEGLSFIRNCKWGLLSQSYSIALQRSDEET